MQQNSPATILPPREGDPDNKIIMKILLEAALYKTSESPGIIKEEYSPSGLTYMDILRSPVSQKYLSLLRPKEVGVN